MTPSDTAFRTSIAVGLGLLLYAPGITGAWVGSASARLDEIETLALQGPQVAIAAASDEDYCSAHLKKVLRRVLQSCGLLSGGGGRGCQPLEAQNVAALSGDDFNKLFVPLASRAGIIQYDVASDELDLADQELLQQIFTDQRGASYFFVVSRSSPEGNPVYNRELSQRRGEAVLDYLRTTFDDPDLDREVGLLWLGEEFAQLDGDFCSWNRSGEGECSEKDINRSAFVAWIDCRL
jgi:hypothetical protein